MMVGAFAIPIGMFWFAWTNYPSIHWIVCIVASAPFGFGMVLLATTVLLVNYFGPSENPEIYGTFNLITTLAMVGPYIGGLIKDIFGGFGGLFQGCAIFMLLIVAMAVAMRPPTPKLS